MATAGAGDTAEQAGEQHLREGCRIELTGLGSEVLNGQRGGIGTSTSIGTTTTSFTATASSKNGPVVWPEIG